jgi:hypothetical protein
MRDIETIDSELRLLVAIRHTAREVEGRPPSTAYIDGCWMNAASWRDAPQALPIRPETSTPPTTVT